MPGYVLVPGLVPVPYTANVTDNLDRGHLASIELETNLRDV